MTGQFIRWCYEMMAQPSSAPLTARLFHEAKHLRPGRTDGAPAVAQLAQRARPLASGQRRLTGVGVVHPPVRRQARVPVAVLAEAEAPGRGEHKADGWVGDVQDVERLLPPRPVDDVHLDPRPDGPGGARDLVHPFGETAPFGVAAAARARPGAAHAAVEVPAEDREAPNLREARDDVGDQFAVIPPHLGMADAQFLVGAQIPAELRPPVAAEPAGI